MKSFRDKMLEVRPEIAVREAEFRDKIDLAMELRALRDTANLSQEQIATLSELSLGDVQTCESLTGDMPAPEDVAAYRSTVHAYKSTG
ncbi:MULTISPECIES: helix-turn-helix domain-containing protein [Thioclava]|uniref:Helix-turn-helix domain-containing protein n=1 Tax=Thioclava electrotropha TaxID=1549850 RepID=A0ABX6Z140_9RHOB|nr:MULTISPECIES: helix-turn-helix transcriptional regulator [Thioclava]MPQ96033.1 helix-turn-helix domain-containing protein [Thioclava sp. JE_KL1]QPZ93389.1 helix-turn-helix domain-containing protein [Thioclava electrotropha]